MLVLLLLTVVTVSAASVCIDATNLCVRGDD